MSEHQWGHKLRCTNAGCTIILNAAHPQWWRRGWAHSKWQKTPIPPCTGKQLSSGPADNLGNTSEEP